MKLLIYAQFMPIITGYTFDASKHTHTKKTTFFKVDFLKLNSLLLPNDEILLINKNIVIKGHRKKNLQMF